MSMEVSFSFSYFVEEYHEDIFVKSSLSFGVQLCFNYVGKVELLGVLV